MNDEYKYLAHKQYTESVRKKLPFLLFFHSGYMNYRFTSLQLTN